MKKHEREIKRILETYTGIELLGTFENEYGEVFALFEMKVPTNRNELKTRPVVIVIGDEMDWDLGYIYENGVLGRQFLLSQDEKKQIQQVVDNFYQN